MRYYLLILAACVIATMLILGKRGDHSRRTPLEIFPDMDRQLKLRPQADAHLTPDGRSSRLAPTGAIARGDRFADLPVNTGRIPGTTNFVENLPVEVTPKLMARGQERFNIYCSPCHGQLGDGNGITKKIGAMAVVASLHDQRIVKLADGEVFNTISYGKNLMGPYAANITVDDRWAIVAYLRALQFSRLATLDDVAPEQREALKKKL